MDKVKNKSILKKISNVLITTLLVVAGLVATLIIVEKISGTSLTGYHLVWVKTDSMEPTIEERSYILTKDINGEDVKENDIVTFLVNDSTSPINGQYNTHRVIEISSDNRLITKGDNNPAQDANWVDRSDVQAKFVKTLPIITFFGRFFSEVYGFIVVIVLILVLAGLWFWSDYKDKKKAKKQELEKELFEKEMKRLEEEAKAKKGE